MSTAIHSNAELDDLYTFLYSCVYAGASAGRIVFCVSAFYCHFNILLFRPYIYTAETLSLLMAMIVSERSISVFIYQQLDFLTLYAVLQLTLSIIQLLTN